MLRCLTVGLATVREKEIPQREKGTTERGKDRKRMIEEGAERRKYGGSK